MENHHFNRRYISKWWISHCYVCTVFSKKKMMAPSKNPPQAELGRHSIWTHRIPSLLNPRQNQKLKTVGFKLPSREPSHIPPNRWKPEHHRLKKVPAGMGIKKKAPKTPLVFICIFLLREIFYVSYLAYGIMKLAIMLGGTGIARMPTWHFLLFFQFLFHQRSKRLPGFL